MMRYLLIAVFFCIGSTIMAQSDKPSPSPVKGAEDQKRSATKPKKAEPDKRGTDSSGFVGGPKSGEPAAGQKTESQDQGSSGKTILDIVLAIATAGAVVVTAFFTGKLYSTTHKQWLVSQKSAAASALAAKAARRSADAAVNAAMPFLQPIIANTLGLHPLVQSAPDEVRHRPTAALVFENLGKSPAVIRRVSTEVLLIPNDELPDEPPGDHVVVTERSEAIAADIRGADAAVRAMDRPIRLSFYRDIGGAEIRALNANDQPFLRFFVVGHVIYDDFFGQRITQHFAVKVRAHGWQAVSGGAHYNVMKREKAPKDDGVTVASEG